MTLDPGARNVRAILPFPYAPEVTAITPTGAAYTKVVPDDDVLAVHVRARTTTENLVWASVITHKVADATTTIAAADPDDLAKSKTAADEILADSNTHIANLSYHQAAADAWYAGHIEDDATNLSTADDMASLATGYVLADELDDDVTAHLLSTVFHAVATVAANFGGTPAAEPALRTKVNLLRTAMISHFGDAAAHGGTADPINAALATATTVGSDEATDQTLINLLKAYWNSHCAVGDATAADLAAVVVASNAAKAGIVAHLEDDSVAHGGQVVQSIIDTLEAIAAASDQATAKTLLTGIKAAYNAHCAVVDNGAYVTVAAALLPMTWACRGSFFVKTSGPGVFTVAEFKSTS